MNKNIILISHDTFHGSNIESIEFELHGKKYFATKTWDANGKTIDCQYGRSMPNEYYDTISTLEGQTGWMMNKSVSCIFWKIPESLFNEIAGI